MIEKKKCFVIVMRNSTVQMTGKLFSNTPPFESPFKLLQPCEQEGDLVSMSTMAYNVITFFISRPFISRPSAFETRAP